MTRSHWKVEVCESQGGVPVALASPPLTRSATASRAFGSSLPAVLVTGGIMAKATMYGKGGQGWCFS